MSRAPWQRREFLQADSRLGFEASNQYYYVPMALAKKILNCRDLEQRGLPVPKTRNARSK